MTGDVVCIMPENLDETVHQFFKHSKLNPRTVAKVGTNELQM